MLELLSKLLANENITLQRGTYATASFNIVSRVLRLPTLVGMEEEEELMMMLHEVGHALFTDMEYVDSIQSRGDTKRNFGLYMNVLEDVRIERKMKTLYPGTRRDFFVGYKKLRDRDFFGISQTDLGTLSLIDRINLYYKVGFSCGVKFTTEEMVFVVAADNTETIDDVVVLAEQIYARAVEQKKFAEEKRAKEKSSGVVVEDEDEDELNDDMSFDEPTEVEDEEVEDEDKGVEEKVKEKDEEVEKVEDEDKEVKEKVKAGLVEDMGLESVRGNSASKGAGSSADESVDTDLGVNDAAPAPTTQETFDNNLSDVFSTDDILYIQPKLTSDYFLVDFKKFVDRQNINGKNPVLSEKTISERTNIRRAAAYLHREFQLKKTAARYSRQAQANSGAINAKKLFQYKISSDIFRKYDIVADDQNHGIIVLLDFSGSMASQIKSAILEIYVLVTFANMAKIPFRVMLFSEFTNDRFSNKNNVGTRVIGDEGIGFFGRVFSLVEIATSEVPFREVETAMQQMMARNFGKFPMQSTPLCESILALDNVIPKFKVKYNLQKVSLITITDGESNSIEPTGAKYGRKYFVADPVTNKKYPIAFKDAEQKPQNILMKLLRERYSYLTIIGYFIVSKFTKTSLTEFVKIYDSANTRGWTSALEDRAKALAEASKGLGMIKTKAVGYDTMMIFVGDTVTEDFSLSGITQKSSVASIARNFSKGMNNGINNKVVLSNLIDYLS